MQLQTNPRNQTQSQKRSQRRDSSDEFSKGDLFSILKNDRRRYAIEVLTDKNEITLPDLASQVTVQESEDSTNDDGHYRSVYVSFQQTHVPRLCKDGVIEYDERTKTVVPGLRFDEVASYLDHGSEPPRSDVWTLYVSVVGALLILLSLVGIAPLGQPVLTVVCLGLFVLNLLMEGYQNWY